VLCNYKFTTGKADWALVFHSPNELTMVAWLRVIGQSWSPGGQGAMLQRCQHHEGSTNAHGASQHPHPWLSTESSKWPCSYAPAFSNAPPKCRTMPDPSALQRAQIQSWQQRISSSPALR
jgi:hypothetical protein